jgi:hypothetical protein
MPVCIGRPIARGERSEMKLATEALQGVDLVQIWLEGKAISQVRN